MLKAHQEVQLKNQNLKRKNDRKRKTSGKVQRLSEGEYLPRLAEAYLSRITFPLRPLRFCSV